MISRNYQISRRSRRGQPYRRDGSP
jgi:hypothetical protein